jgi:hypothetical protein
MAIAKKPVRNQADIAVKSDEKAAEAFIAKAGKPAEKEPEQGEGLTPVLMRFRKPLLKRIDEAAKRRSVRRTPWIMYVITRALEEEGL